MNNNDNFNFDFDDKYEDIVSDSKRKTGKREYEDISSYSSPRKKAKNKKKTTKQKWMMALKVSLISLTAIFLVLAILIGYFLKRFDYNYDNKFHVDVKQKNEDIINVALFGVDSRDIDDFTGRTDSIMILSINQKTDTIKIISVMRDTFVPIMDEKNNFKNYGKINSAYASGKDDVTKSAEIAVNTLNSVYDLDISNYAVVNFFGMIEIIDAVGGITANITQDELNWKGDDHPNLNNCMDEICAEKGLRARDYYITKPGEQKLNGVQAVAYARVRHCKSIWGTNDDFGRTDRQRHVMQELFNKAVKIEKSRYVSLIDALIPCSQTSLSPTEILDLAVSVLLQKPSFEQYRLPPDGYVYDMMMTPNFNAAEAKRYGSVVYYDLDYAAEMVNAIIFDDMTVEEFVESNPIERKYWFPSAGGNNTSGGNEPPSGGNEIPDGGNETPDGGDETPDGGNETPDGGDETPDGGNETPDGGGETPDGGGETPDGGNETPDGGGETPDGSGETPDGGGETPDGGGQTPDGGGQTPDGGSQTPDGDNNTPPTTEVLTPKQRRI